MQILGNPATIEHFSEVSCQLPIIADTLRAKGDAGDLAAPEIDPYPMRPEPT